MAIVKISIFIEECVAEYIVVAIRRVIQRVRQQKRPWEAAVDLAEIPWRNFRFMPELTVHASFGQVFR